MRTTTEARASAGMLKRLVWFVALWLAGVVTVGAVAAALRWVMHAL